MRTDKSDQSRNRKSLEHFLSFSLVLHWKLLTFQGKITYYHQIVIEKDGSNNFEHKSFVNVKCWFSGNKNHTVAKRNVLPAGFQEPE